MLNDEWMKTSQLFCLKKMHLYFFPSSCVESKIQKKKKEETIVAKEKQAAELRQKYFGPDGELYKKRQSLMKPIQEDVYNAVKKVSEERGYQCIFDRASAADIIFASPRIDVSNEVLEKLGYSK